eukprot:3554959-Pyramimonas_sp.AAC.1
MGARRVGGGKERGKEGMLPDQAGIRAHENHKNITSNRVCDQPENGGGKSVSSTDGTHIKLTDSRPLQRGVQAAQAGRSRPP